MLGLLYDTGSRIRFVATSSFRLPHGDDGFWRAWRAIDARHGRVLLHARVMELGEPLFAVWNPITGEWRVLFTLGKYLAYCLKLRSWSAAVLCAGVACDHRDCHRRPFQVVIVSSNREQMDAFVYSSVTDEWRQPASSQLQYHGARFHLVASIAFVGSTLYFVFGAGTELLEYNLASHQMSVIDLPPTFSEQYSVCITTQDGRLGFARTEDSKLHLWSREAGHDGDAGGHKVESLSSRGCFPPLNVT
ncbi:hypothetical protein C2845_PM18G05910 [Panicum miliaceum]|uniref:F-box/kelch-repeat protein n=1 Tax=Panicum miliaceum TaxID=4540 RepID=A0A3L6PN74_PANMI|nr:hypothetical protein C2845_PM18G05910 [Panicum miliaceum]